MEWYEANAGRWASEQEVAARFLDGLKTGIDETGRAWLGGRFRLLSGHGHEYDVFDIRIVYPKGFPLRSSVPSVVLDSHRDCWKKELNGHIYGDWQLCLYLPGECGIDFARRDSLIAVFESLHSFLLKERIYQRDLKLQEATGEPATWPGPERAHGNDGIREMIHERGKLGPNEPCPCGSGKKYKKCHYRTMGRVR